jgi:DNA-binding XRE family transcriptional regulator
MENVSNLSHTASLSHTVCKELSNYFLPMAASRRLGMKLQSMRIERNMTQLQMAMTFSIDHGLVNDLESGRRAASIGTLELLAAGMKVTLSELLRDL